MLNGGTNRAEPKGLTLSDNLLLPVHDWFYLLLGKDLLKPVSSKLSEGHVM